MTQPVTAEQRAQIVRDLCNREDHRWLETTSHEDRWDQWTCGRGCGTTMTGDPRGIVSANALRQLADELEGRKTTIRRLQITVEDV